MPVWMDKFMPIAILLVVVGIVLARLPKVEGVEHSSDFRRRRVFNWLPLGLTYAFLYMGRYNIKVSQHAFGDIDFNGAPMMTNGDFATIFFWGTALGGILAMIFGIPLTAFIIIAWRLLCRKYFNRNFCAPAEA